MAEQNDPKPDSPESSGQTPAGETREPKRKIGFGPPMGSATVPPALNDPEKRRQWGLPEAADEPGPYMVELNLTYEKGLKTAADDFVKLFREVVGEAEAQKRPPVTVSKTYFQCTISVDEFHRLVRRDEAAGAKKHRVIYKIWPDFPVKPLIDRSIATVKSDAALRSYAASGAGIVWAVIDSGIDASHPHFGDDRDPATEVLTHSSVKELHRDFTQTAEDGGPLPGPTALVDKFGHGTHVAGIIAGELPDWAKDKLEVFENVFVSEPAGGTVKRVDHRRIGDGATLRGVAPRCKLISLKVLNDDGDGRASDVIRAMHYIAEDLNGDPKMLRVHGINLSIGYDFDAEMFACGQSPLCVEVDRLVKSGVVVVVAAGNTGYGKINADQGVAKGGLTNTINDPGNADLAITVGATHRDSPHTYGVSYFSSKGPTGDGRLKPDLVAPGERITSCAAGQYLKSQGGEVPDGIAGYIDDTGTSMAAPHVSGAIAAFLSIRREFIQRPEEVKRIFLEGATCLGREKYFEGHGLVDLMRAIQSV